MYDFGLTARRGLQQPGGLLAEFVQTYNLGIAVGQRFNFNRMLGTLP